MARDKVYFLSDLHLGAAYIDDPRGAERRIVSFIESLRGDAKAIYLMGDILDYWFEYRTVVPRGYVRFFGALASLADSGVEINWFIGNHDIWLFDYLRNELGINVIDGSTVKDIMGKRFFLAHGDGVGRLRPGFRLIRAIFRNRVCQKLFAAIHPRWTVPLAYQWSKHNRLAKVYAPVFRGMDDEPLALFAKEYYRDVDPTINYFVFGHIHVLVDQPISPTCRFIILGDWIRQYSYAVFDGTDLQIQIFTPSKFLD